MQVNIPVSVGELFDKFSILSIKLDKIADPRIQAMLQFEYDLLKEKIDNTILRGYLIDEYRPFQNLLTINKELWVIEDEIRKKEAKKEFDNKFIVLARSVYMKNDQRFKIKAEINKHFKSDIVEVKQYKKY